MRWWLEGMWIRIVAAAPGSHISGSGKWLDWFQMPSDVSLTPHTGYFLYSSEIFFIYLFFMIEEETREITLIKKS